MTTWGYMSWWPGCRCTDCTLCMHRWRRYILIVDSHVWWCCEFHKGSMIQSESRQSRQPIWWRNRATFVLLFMIIYPSYIFVGHSKSVCYHGTISISISNRCTWDDGGIWLYYYMEAIVLEHFQSRLVTVLLIMERIPAAIWDANGRWFAKNTPDFWSSAAGFGPPTSLAKYSLGTLVLLSWVDLIPFQWDLWQNFASNIWHGAHILPSSLLKLWTLPPSNCWGSKICWGHRRRLRRVIFSTEWALLGRRTSVEGSMMEA